MVGLWIRTRFRAWRRGGVLGLGLLLFLLVKAWGAEAPEESLLYSANPAGDRPDDTFRYQDLIVHPDPKILKKPQETPGARVGVLDRGYASAALALITRTRPASRIPLERVSHLVPSTSQNPPSDAWILDVLVIPSGGLGSTGEPPPPWEALERYVRAGGALLVLDQPFGKDYEGLPVPGEESLSGYGWLEAQSVMFQSAYSSRRVGPGARFAGPWVHLNLDGFFVQYPQGAQVWYRERVSGQPVILAYAVGEGVVVATTLFTDWAYTHQRATQQEVDLVGALLEWTLSEDRRADLERRFGSPEPLPPLGFAVVSEHEQYPLGAIATFTILIWNHSSEERNLYVFYEGKGGPVRVLPGQVARMTDQIPVFSSRRLWFYFHNEQKQYLTTLWRGHQVRFGSSVDVGLSVEPKAPRPGDTLQIQLQFTLRQEEALPVEGRFTVFRPDHTVLYEALFQETLDPRHPLERTFQVPLPQTAPGGTYLVSAEVVNPTGARVGVASLPVNLPLTQVRAIPRLPREVVPGERAVLEVHLENLGTVPVQAGRLTARLLDPAGHPQMEATLPFQLPVDASTVLRFPFTLPEVLLGSYQVEILQEDETHPARLARHPVDNLLEIRALFHQPTYRVRETLQVTYKADHHGPFAMPRMQVRWEIPDFSYEETREIFVGAEDRVSLSFQAPIPEGISPGEHPVRLTFLVGSTQITHTEFVRIPPSQVEVLSTRPRYRPGEPIQIRLRNTGGVDTRVHLQVILQSSQGKVVASWDQTHPVRAGEEVPLSLRLPGDLGAGEYTLAFHWKDLRTAREDQAQQFLQIQTPSGDRAARR